MGLVQLVEQVAGPLWMVAMRLQKMVATSSRAAVRTSWIRLAQQRGWRLGAVRRVLSLGRAVEK